MVVAEVASLTKRTVDFACPPPITICNTYIFFFSQVRLERLQIGQGRSVHALYVARRVTSGRLFKQAQRLPQERDQWPTPNKGYTRWPFFTYTLIRYDQLNWRENSRLFKKEGNNTGMGSWLKAGSDRRAGAHRPPTFSTIKECTTRREEKWFSHGKFGEGGCD